MGTKTVSLSDKAYRKLSSLKRDNESFSDVVNRLASGVRLSDYHGILSKESGEELEKAIENRREKSRESHEDRVREIAEEME